MFHSKDDAWRVSWFLPFRLLVFFFPTVNIPLSSQTLLQIFFCSYLKTSALASITWTPFIFPQEEASMLRDIMNARRLFLYRERTAMISSTRKYGSNAVFSHSVYSCFDKRCPTKVSTKVCLIEFQGNSATRTENA